jgi:Skp family chaperone for outer membrane proteins
MDWTQVTMALIVGLPAILAAIGAFINTMRLNKLQEHADRDAPKVAAIQDLANDIKVQNADQTVKLNTIGKAVNGDLDARFTKIEGKVGGIESKIDSLVDAMIAAKLLAADVAKNAKIAEKSC